MSVINHAIDTTVEHIDKSTPDICLTEVISYLSGDSIAAISGYLATHINQLCEGELSAEDFKAIYRGE